MRARIGSASSMRGFLPRLLRARSGNAIVDFALVLPPMLALCFGIIEYGRFFWTQEALEQTAISAARCMAVLNPSCTTGTAGGTYSSTNTQTFITNVASGWDITVKAANTTLNDDATCNGITNFSQVSLSITFDTAVPGILPMLNNGTLSATACFPNVTPPSKL
jgi:Flp pilus assembly protein TadG